jgi:hypothetical protein
MSEASGRALAMIYSDAPTLAEVLARGWEADDFRDLEDVPLMPYRDFASFEEAKAIAARDLPAGTTVGWSSHGGYRRGGFVVGYEHVAPPLGELTPAYVLWPDFSELYVETRDQLVGALRDRLDWIAELALEDGMDTVQVEAGRVAMLHALDKVVAGDRVRAQDCGPLWCRRWTIEPVADIHWNGFRRGWDDPDEPADERHHPVHYDYAGAFQDLWRDAVRSGIAAARARDDA